MVRTPGLEFITSHTHLVAREDYGRIDLFPIRNLLGWGWRCRSRHRRIRPSVIVLSARYGATVWEPGHFPSVGLCVVDGPSCLLYYSISASPGAVRARL